MVINYIIYLHLCSTVNTSYDAFGRYCDVFYRATYMRSANPNSCLLRNTGSEIFVILDILHPFINGTSISLFIKRVKNLYILNLVKFSVKM